MSLKAKILLALLLFSMSGLVSFGLIQKELAKQSRIEEIEDVLFRYGSHLISRAGPNIDTDQVSQSLERHVGSKLGSQLFYVLESEPKNFIYVSESGPKGMKASHWPQSGKVMDPQPNFGETYQPGKNPQKKEKVYKQIDEPKTSFIRYKGMSYYGMHFRNDQLHLVLGLKEQDLWKPLKQLDTSLFIAAALTLVIMSVLSLWIVKLVLEPIRKLGQVMEDVKAHDEKLPDFSDKLEVEFGPIRDAFLHMLNRLQQQYQNTQRFNADISHELKTPLSVLKMSLERALQRDSAEQTQNIVHCLEECENMQSILSKLFLLSQADRGGLSCHFEKLNFKTWLQPFLEDAELLSEELELEILTEIEEADYQLSIDSTLMRTCLYNLIQNAIRYNVLHGFMRFKLSRVENCVHLEISNSGHEIKAEDREQLFERFRRGTSEHQGLGLGLALCKEIVVAHGGRICLKHSNEKESSFLVALPCEREK